MIIKSESGGAFSINGALYGKGELIFTPGANNTVTVTSLATSVNSGNTQILFSGVSITDILPEAEGDAFTEWGDLSEYLADTCFAAEGGAGFNGVINNDGEAASATVGLLFENTTPATPGAAVQNPSITEYRGTGYYDAGNGEQSNILGMRVAPMVELDRGLRMKIFRLEMVGEDETWIEAGYIDGYGNILFATGSLAMQQADFSHTTNPLTLSGIGGTLTIKKTGPNNATGIATLNNGQVTVNTTAAKPGSQIFITVDEVLPALLDDSGVTYLAKQSDIVPNTSFKITARVGATQVAHDGNMSKVRWWILQTT